MQVCPAQLNIVLLIVLQSQTRAILLLHRVTHCTLFVHVTLWYALQITVFIKWQYGPWFYVYLLFQSPVVDDFSLSLSESAHYRIKNNVRSMSRRPYKNRVRHVFWPYVIQCDLGALALILCLFCILVFSAHFICACMLLLCWISCLENWTTFLPIEYRQEGIPVIEYVPSNCYTF